jgi:hypothetical protein
MQVILRPPEPADVRAVASHMRLADVIECAAVGKRDLRHALSEGIERSVSAWTAEVDGVPALITGVAPLHTLLGDTGVPWMLGTDLVTQHQRAFIRMSPDYIIRMLGAFSHLLNFVHAENTAAVRWLKRMGFSMEAAAPYGPYGALFHRFELYGPDHLLARKGRSAAAGGAGEPAGSVRA